jgi:hypothetical protein
MGRKDSAVRSASSEVTMDCRIRERGARTGQRTSDFYWRTTGRPSRGPPRNRQCADLWRVDVTDTSVGATAPNIRLRAMAESFTSRSARLSSCWWRRRSVMPPTARSSRTVTPCSSGDPGMGQSVDACALKGGTGVARCAGWQSSAARGPSGCGRAFGCTAVHRPFR